MFTNVNKALLLKSVLPRLRRVQNIFSTDTTGENNKEMSGNLISVTVYNLVRCVRENESLSDRFEKSSNRSQLFVLVL